MKNNFLLFYKTGTIEVHEEINETFKHMIANETLLFIYDTKKNEVIALNKKGVMHTKKMNINKISEK